MKPEIVKIEGVTYCLPGEVVAFIEAQQSEIKRLRAWGEKGWNHSARMFKKLYHKT